MILSNIKGINKKKAPNSNLEPFRLWPKANNIID